MSTYDVDVNILILAEFLFAYVLSLVRITGPT